MHTTQAALIALEDGTLIPARSFTGPGEAVGELAFNTCMTGYQEVLTDPSGAGSLLTMTYPLIGSYGVNEADMESAAARPKALLVREYQARPSNFRSTGNLADFLKKYGVLGVEGFDTRMLVRKLRDQGALKAAIATDTDNPEALVERARACPGVSGQDMTARVTCRRPWRWTETGPQDADDFSGTGRFRVLVYDFGARYNPLRMLAAHDCDLLVVPASTAAEAALALNPHGVFLSNGPGDPAAVSGAVEEIKKLVGRLPIFGICLGHQILALALGCRTEKLKFGHRGGQPVKHLHRDKLEITYQNTGFHVDKTRLPEGVEMTHVNLNDDTLAGLRHKTLPLFSVQHHPEAGVGTHDGSYLYADFVKMMANK